AHSGDRHGARRLLGLRGGCGDRIRGPIHGRGDDRDGPGPCGGAPAPGRPRRVAGRGRLQEPGPGRRDGRPRQLHGTPGRDRGRAGDRPCGPGARGGRLHALGAPRLRGHRGRPASRRRRHRCAERTGLLPGDRARRPHRDRAGLHERARGGAPDRHRPGHLDRLGGGGGRGRTRRLRRDRARDAAGPRHHLGGAPRPRGRSAPCLAEAALSARTRRPAPGRGPAAPARARRV
ncbi:MAG: tRNA threonylcarbamoyladenosine biosynthesis protein TsaB, partial [uncultured Microvirga sp.]